MHFHSHFQIFKFPKFELQALASLASWSEEGGEEEQGATTSTESPQSRQQTYRPRSPPPSPSLPPSLPPSLQTAWILRPLPITTISRRRTSHRWTSLSHLPLSTPPSLPPPRSIHLSHPPAVKHCPVICPPSSLPPSLPPSHARWGNTSSPSSSTWRISPPPPPSTRSLC